MRRVLDFLAAVVIVALMPFAMLIRWAISRLLVSYDIAGERLKAASPRTRKVALLGFLACVLLALGILAGMALGLI